MGRETLYEPGIILSIHFNGFGDPRVRGTEVYVSDTGPADDHSLRLGEYVLEALIAEMQDYGFASVNRGVKSDKYKTEYLAYTPLYGFDARCDDCKRLLTLGNNPMSPRGGNWKAGALVEILFLSNPRDVEFLKREDAPDINARGLFKGILNFVERERTQNEE